MMICSFLTNNNFFDSNNIIIIGWFALIFAPFRKISKYLILFPALILSTNYTLMLFRRLFIQNCNNPEFDFFDFSGWQSLFQDIYMNIGIDHFSVIDLWIGRWIVEDFYSGYTFIYNIRTTTSGTYAINHFWNLKRLMFTSILLLTYIVAPFGFLLYNLLKYTILKKYRTNVRINVIDGENFVIENSHLHQSQKTQFNHSFVHFGDQFPQPLLTIYHISIAIFGLILLFTIALPSYFLLTIYCRIVYRNNHQSLNQSNLSEKVPEYVRYVTANIRLKLLTIPINQRNWLWSLKFVLLELSTFIEYIVNSSQPYPLLKSLEEYFNEKFHQPYYLFGNGIAVNSYQLVKRYLQDIPPRKDYGIVGWNISSSLKTFCDFTTIFLSSDNEDMKLGRNIIFKWLHAFPHHLSVYNYQTQLSLSRIVPRQGDQMPTKHEVYQAIGEVMFYLSTGGQLNKTERLAFIDCVEKSAIFFPDWFNFLLLGRYFERKTLNSYYTLLKAFSRYANGDALQAAFKEADQKKSKEDVLRLITIVFSVAGSAAPAKLAVTVIEKIWLNKQINVPLFEKNPKNFVKECARLDKVVPIVTVLANQDIVKEVNDAFQNKYQFEENTPIHCSIVNANRDKNVFQNPDQFQPDRLDLNKIFVWNGVEEDIINPDPNKRPIRYCPGHDLSIDTIVFVVQRFLPFIINNVKNDKIHQQSTGALHFFFGFSIGHQLNIYILEFESIQPSNTCLFLYLHLDINQGMKVLVI